MAKHGSNEDKVPLQQGREKGTSPTLSESQKTASSKAWYAVAFAATISSMTAATLGYDVGIMAAAIDFISDTMNLNHSQTQLVVGSLNFISAFGTLIAGQTSDRFGRKKTVWICCFLYVGGTALMSLAMNYYVLLLGRIVTGLGVGVSFVVVPVYISEITPSDARGMLSTCFDISINVGILLGYIIGYLVVELGESLSKDTKWRSMLAMGASLPVIVMLSLSYLPESPRWLMANGRFDEATTAMTQFLGDEQLAQEAINDIIQDMQQDGLIVSTSEEGVNEEEAGYGGENETDHVSVNGVASGGGGGSQQPLTWREVFKLDPVPASESYLHRVIFLVVCVGFWQQSTGSEAILYYSSTFLEQAGLKSTKERLLGYVLIGLCKLLPEAGSMFLVDSWGRRPLFLFSSYGLTFSMFVIAFVFVFASANQAAFIVVLLCVFMIFFSIGVGPITWLLASEMLPLRARAKGMTLCCFVNRLISGTVALSALSTCDALGYSGFFAFYGTMGVLGSIWYTFNIPETKGKTLEEITAMFKSKYDAEDAQLLVSSHQQQQRQQNENPIHSPLTP